MQGRPEGRDTFLSESPGVARGRIVNRKLERCITSTPATTKEGRNDERKFKCLHHVFLKIGIQTDIHILNKYHLFRNFLTLYDLTHSVSNIENLSKAKKDMKHI